MGEVDVIWKPAWHELDQDLEIGLMRTYYLDTTSQPFRFTTGLDGDVDGIEATILSISHSQLGDIKRIDCSGLSYKLYSTGGSFTQIEAEERPGFVEKGFMKGQKINDLDFKVRLQIL